MKRRDMLRDPIWQASEVGAPIPDSRHAVSVALPRWEDVVAYEEKSPHVLSRMQCGYPRFVIHPLVQEVANRLGAGQPCLPFPSRQTAEAAAAFVRQQSGAPTSLVAARGLHAVVTNDAGAGALKNFWQHTGWIVSSRQAEAWLAEQPEEPEADENRRSLRRQLAAFYDCGEDDVFLTVSGMAAQAEALRAVLRRAPSRPTVQMGFPYVDTLKLQQKLGHGAQLIHDLDHVETQLRQYLQSSTPAACFGEIPGNPLLGSVNLRRITPLLRAQGIPFVADDVVATPVNVDLSGYADLIATSLTKFVVGSGDVMAGALICNPRSPYHAELKGMVQSQHEELFWGADARVLEAQARGFPERMRLHNRNGLAIAERLRAHPAVERVWYPKWEFTEAYEAVRRPDGGWGSLITFLPRDAERRSPQIYDRLTLCKGPSLGTEFTLACPFTLLAHYTELDWAESCGVSRYLIRVSIGLEEVEELWRRFEAALRD
jgi:cystathionine gamma-synthase